MSVLKAIIHSSATTHKIFKYTLCKTYSFLCYFERKKLLQRYSRMKIKQREICPLNFELATTSSKLTFCQIIFFYFLLRLCLPCNSLRSIAL